MILRFLRLFSKPTGTSEFFFIFFVCVNNYSTNKGKHKSPSRQSVVFGNT